jgi:hypothetical protein
MKKLSYFLCTLTGALALGAGACSSSGNNNTGTGGSTGAGGAGNSLFPGGIPLTPVDTGFVDDRSNTGIVGPWYTYADTAGPAANASDTDFADSSCNKGHFTASQCSSVMPTPGQVFPPVQGKGMCASGVGAVVLAGTNGQNDYSDIWGAGIALDFNNLGGDAGAKGTFDLTKYKGIGFTFSGDMVPVNKMRVNFPFVGEHADPVDPTKADSPYWKGDMLDHSPLLPNQTYKIYWNEVAGPDYLTKQTPAITPPPFDPTKVQSIQFQVFTNASTTTPFSFCVDNLTLLTE